LNNIIFISHTGTFLVALTTLMTGLVQLRVFDVIMTPNPGYMTITCAMFAYGLAGIMIVLRPELAESLSRSGRSGKCCQVFAASMN